MTNMNLNTNQIKPTTKCRAAKATSAAMMPPPISNTRSKVLRPDRSSLTSVNVTGRGLVAIGMPGTCSFPFPGGTVR